MRSILLVLICVLLCGTALPQSQPSAAVLRQLTQRSKFIFGGTVNSVERLASPGIPTVRITFTVDRAVRGVRAGQTFTIREWAGLWSAGPRYRPGQHVFLFLYPTSKLGLTSPVSGNLGRFDIDNDDVVLGREHLDALPNRQTSSTTRRSRLSSRDFARAIRRAAED